MNDHDPRPMVDDDPQEPDPKLDPADPRHLAIRSSQRLQQLLVLGAPSTIIEHEMEVLTKRVKQVISGAPQEAEACGAAPRLDIGNHRCTKPKGHAGDHGDATHFWYDDDTSAPHRQ